MKIIILVSATAEWNGVKTLFPKYSTTRNSLKDNEPNSKGALSNNVNQIGNDISICNIKILHAAMR